MNGLPLLSLLTFAPLVGAAVMLFLPRDNARLLRVVALAVCAVCLAIVGAVLSVYDPSATSVQLVERFAWIPTLRIEYSLGVDGKSILMVLLTALLVPMAVLASWKVEKNPRLYFFLLMLLQAGMFGAFTALSFFHWFLFWEFVLVPAYFLIKIWGGPNGNAAALKFFLYTLVGSVCMLLSFTAIYLATDSFDFITLPEKNLPYALTRLATNAGLHLAPGTAAFVALGGILLACAIKTPMWPFHTWLPDVYAEAPAPVTMLLTAVLSKLGIYGLIRLALPLFPAEMQAMTELLMPLAVVTIVAGAFSAWAQSDLKRMIAFSSVNHVGYCLLGVFAAVVATKNYGAAEQEQHVAMAGVLLQMFNHGVTAACLFFFLGALEERARMRGINDFGGLRQVMPGFSLVFGIALFASLGLPGLNGFVGELLIFKGAFGVAPIFAGLALFGVLVTTLFLLSIMQRVFWSPVNQRVAHLSDLDVRERIAAVVFVILIVVGGLLPGMFLQLIGPTGWTP